MATSPTSQKMMTSLRGFDTPVYTLLLGPEHRKIFVPGYVLMQIIPFVQLAKDGGLSEDEPVALEQYDASSFTFVLALLRDGVVEFPQPPSRAHYFEAYVVAYDFDLEGIQNLLVDELEKIYRLHGVDTGDWEYLFDSELPFSCKLRFMMLHRLAHDILRECRRQTTVQSPDGLLRLPMFNAMTKKLAPEDLVSIIYLVTVIVTGGSENTFEQPCCFHQHVLTKPCARLNAISANHVEDSSSTIQRPVSVRNDQLNYTHFASDETVILRGSTRKDTRAQAISFLQTRKDKSLTEERIINVQKYLDDPRTISELKAELEERLLANASEMANLIEEQKMREARSRMEFGIPSNIDSKVNADTTTPRSTIDLHDSADDVNRKKHKQRIDGTLESESKSNLEPSTKVQSRSKQDGTERQKSTNKFHPEVATDSTPTSSSSSSTSSSKRRSANIDTSVPTVTVKHNDPRNPHTIEEEMQLDTQDTQSVNRAPSLASTLDFEPRLTITPSPTSSYVDVNINTDTGAGADAEADIEMDTDADDTATLQACEREIRSYADLLGFPKMWQ